MEKKKLRMSALKTELYCLKLKESQS